MERFVLDEANAKKLAFRRLPKRVLWLVSILVLLSFWIIKTFELLEVDRLVLVCALTLAFFITCIMVFYDTRRSIRKLANSYLVLEGSMLIHFFADGEKLVITLSNLDKIVCKNHGLIVKGFNRKYYISDLFSNSSTLFQKIIDEAEYD